MNKKDVLKIIYKPSDLQIREILRLLEMAKELKCSFELGDVKEFMVGSFGNCEKFFTFKELAITLGYEIVYDLTPNLFEPDNFMRHYEIEVRDNVLYFNNWVLDNYRHQTRKEIIRMINHEMGVQNEETY